MDDDLERLTDRLVNGDPANRSIGGYPMTPEDAAELIVSTLLHDLPEARRKTIRKVIEEWAGEREHRVSSTVMESSSY